jgi:hypothetical protein
MAGRQTMIQPKTKQRRPDIHCPDIPNIPSDGTRRLNFAVADTPCKDV